MTRPFHLGWFLGNSYGVHGWRQAWGGTTARDWAKPDLQVDMVRALERACFDFLLLEDSLFVPDNYGGSTEFYLSRALRAPKNDPLPLIPLLAQATKHLGLVPTISTSFYPPYLLARLIATLDLMSDGRVGCNFVTSTAARAAQNFGLQDHIEHHRRYAMAEEFVTLVTKLWESWDEDALPMDAAAGVFADHRKVHPVDFQGEFFASRGPLNTARPPQGRPVLVQAGSSPQGRHFASAQMDVVLAAYSTVPEMVEFRADMRRRLAERGRDPDSCKCMFVIAPCLGETRAEAEERFARRQAAKQASPELVLAQMASLTDIDFSRFDLDAPIEELTTNGQQGTLRQFLAQGRTLREIARNYRYGMDDLIGTPDDVAARMDEIMQEVGGDGFVVTGPVTRRYLAEITDGLAPALQARGLMRTGYASPTFRANLFEF
ncbi:NtaA/DmoA family FMN-dependent monooxygenase [Paracraurococcus ruber]|uniref:FMNH2-dependent monooxygenase n=1 Tax=Paracraurococcus ruber TaxID=77675 RepID=A0ABS1CYK5_9PROT|nr:NtaA/DmoA family FMN-dependent monooxygenase [Paracraurococcus ruber]MBK1658789.1 FMNH2-dependent monooxygenase [Paracraurococcus ruber]TDG30102.1 LLM class flavin-dependent oxidoreductase [Paracraurococcus ruber]